MIGLKGIGGHAILPFLDTPGTDTTAVNCCALEKGWNNIPQDPYRCPETVELDEVLYVVIVK